MKKILFRNRIRRWLFPELEHVSEFMKALSEASNRAAIVPERIGRIIVVGRVDNSQIRTNYFGVMGAITNNVITTKRDADFDAEAKLSEDSFNSNRG